MAARFNQKAPKRSDQFPVVDDLKLRMSLIQQADKWNEYARSMIYATYNDAKLLMLYKTARDSGIFQHGNKSKTMRKVVEFPNGFVYNYCKAVFEPEYGKQWTIHPKVLRHELMRPWLVIDIH